MRRHIPVVLGLALALARPVGATTFAQTPIAPDLGIDHFTRGATRQLIGRDVFANPYATVTVSHTDIYDRFPYVESRDFVVVSDPQWNRLVFGQTGQDLGAFDGTGTAVGALSNPHGLAVDEQDRVYVADTGNDRIVVLQASSDFGQLTLTPLYTIPGLHAPYGVAVSDAGTAFVPGDDVLYVADTGMNRVVAFALDPSGAHVVATLGRLGAGTGAFAGPMAIAAGRSNGVNTADLYVADAQNRRIVQLHLAPAGLQWLGEAPANADVVTSLDTDHWGNVYAAAPQQGVVRKYSPQLEAVAELRESMAHPRAFHVPFTTVSDHRDGSVRRAGQSSGLSVDQWGDDSGMRMWRLGVSVDGLTVAGGGSPVAHFTLTDPSTLTLEVADAAGGQVTSRRTLGAMAAGAHDVTLSADDLRGLSTVGDATLRISAPSSYAGGTTAVALATFHATGTGAAAPSRPVLIGSAPNPLRGSTQIAFALPQNPDGRVALDVIDAGGRRVRGFPRAFSPGLNQVTWDGTDDNGRPVKPGLYFTRLVVGSASFSRRVVVLR